MGVGWLKGILETKAGIIDCSYTGNNQLKQYYQKLNLEFEKNTKYIWETGLVSTGTPIFNFTYVVGYPNA